VALEACPGGPGAAGSRLPRLSEEVAKCAAPPPLPKTGGEAFPAQVLVAAAVAVSEQAASGSATSSSTTAALALAQPRADAAAEVDFTAASHRLLMSDSTSSFGGRTWSGGGSTASLKALWRVPGHTDDGFYSGRQGAAVLARAEQEATQRKRLAKDFVAGSVATPARPPLVALLRPLDTEDGNGRAARSYGMEHLPERRPAPPAHKPYDWAWLGGAPEGRWILDQGRPRCVQVGDASRPPAHDLRPARLEAEEAPEAPDAPETEVLLVPSNVEDQFERMTDEELADDEEVEYLDEVADLGEHFTMSTLAKSCLGSEALTMLPGVNGPKDPSKLPGRIQSKTSKVGFAEEKPVQALCDAPEDIQEILEPLEQGASRRLKDSLMTKLPRFTWTRAPTVQANGGGAVPSSSTNARSSVTRRATIMMMKERGLRTSVKRPLSKTRLTTVIPRPQPVDSRRSVPASFLQKPDDVSEDEQASGGSSMPSSSSGRKVTVMQVPEVPQQPRKMSAVSMMAGPGSPGTEEDPGSPRAMGSETSFRSGSARESSASALQGISDGSSRRHLNHRGALAFDGEDAAARALRKVLKQENHSREKAQGRKKERDLRAEMRRLKDMLFSSAQSAFGSDVWEVCGIESEHLKKKHMAELLGSGLALGKKKVAPASEEEPESPSEGATTKRRSRSSRRLTVAPGSSSVVVATGSGATLKPPQGAERSPRPMSTSRSPQATSPR